MNDLEKILSTSFLVPMGDPRDEKCVWGLNVMLWGPPGIGKSERIENAGAMVGLPVRPTYIPTCQPEDASGAPFANATKGLAMMESILFTLEEYLEDSEGNLDTEATWAELGLNRLMGVHREKSFNFVPKVIKNMVRAARRYGPAFSRIEPTLPGVSDLIADGEGVWFLDEISSARPAVQGGFLGAVLARRIGGVKLPPRIRVVAAGNPASSAAGGWDMEPPMANRWCHIDTGIPTTKEFDNWLNDRSEYQFESIENGQQRVIDNWPGEWATVRGVVSGYLATKPALHELPPEGNPDRGRAWMSPRTFNFALRAWTTCRCLGYDDVFAMKLIQGCIGEAATTKLAKWVTEADLPKPLDVLNNGWVVDKKRLDRCMAVYSSITNYVIECSDPNEQVELAIKAWKRLEESASANLFDLSVQHAQTLIRAKLNSAHKTRGSELAEASRPVLMRAVKSGVHLVA